MSKKPNAAAKAKLANLRAWRKASEPKTKKHEHNWQYIEAEFVMGHCMAVFQCECGKAKQEEL